MKELYHRILYKLGYSYRFGRFRKNYVSQKQSFYDNKKILNATEGNLLIGSKIDNEKPFLAARLGSVELSALYNYFLLKNGRVKWDEEVVRTMQTNAGFFPASPDNLKRFAEEMFQHLQQVDLLGVWYNEGEKEICTAYCKQASFTDLTALEPYYFPEHPWSKHLANKKVLVIHPFADSIQYQYTNNQSKLFPQTDVLPAFELKTIKAVQSIAGSDTDFKDWFDAYNFMCSQIKETDFDIAIIGAGAYGLPLGSYVKQLGKQAVHMGGATQLLFGIIGNRWIDRPEVSKLFNEYWKRPYPYETPKDAVKIENACYW